MDDNDRWLQSDNRNSIFFMLYFCLLICCCVTPFLYYLRLYLFQRMRMQRLRELEHTGLMAIIQHTMNHSDHHPQDSSMMQQERKARILQMMEPVRKKLESSDFRRAESSSVDHGDNTTTETTEEEDKPQMICVPIAGIIVSSDASSVSARPESRWVPAHCPICIGSFETAGSDVVWSSNPECPHVFHTSCMEPWLLKNLQEEPMCPCCRRQFLVDPYDLLEDRGTEEDDEEQGIAMQTTNLPNNGDTDPADTAGQDIGESSAADENGVVDIESASPRDDGNDDGYVSI